MQSVCLLGNWGGDSNLNVHIALNLEHPGYSTSGLAKRLLLRHLDLSASIKDIICNNLSHRPPVQQPYTHTTTTSTTTCHPTVVSSYHPLIHNSLQPTADRTSRISTSASARHLHHVFDTKHILLLPPPKITRPHPPSPLFALRKALTLFLIRRHHR